MPNDERSTNDEFQRLLMMFRAPFPLRILFVICVSSFVIYRDCQFTSARGCDLRASHIAGRVSRPGDVFDDGGGAEFIASGGSEAGERVLEIPRAPSNPCGVDRLL